MIKKILNNDSENFVLLLLSAVILISINFKWPVWFIDDFGSVDPWLYYATGEYFDYIKKHLYDTYYFRRWTVTLGNLLFSSIFGPFYGMFVLKSLIFFFGLFFLQKIIYKISNKSFLITFISIFSAFLFHKQLIITVGTSYVQSLSFLLVLIYIYLLIIHENQSKDVTLIALLISLILITYQGNIKFIIPTLILFFFDENLKFVFNKFVFKKLIKLTILTIVFITLIDETIQFILSIDLRNFFIYTYRTELNVRGPFITGYDTFYQDLFGRLYKQTYLTGALLSILIIANFKLIKSILYKKICIFYIFFSFMNLLEPFHKLGFSIYVQAKWLHLLFSATLSFSFFILLFIELQNKLDKKNNQNSFFFLLKFISNLFIVLFIIFANHKVGNNFLASAMTMDFNKAKERIYKTNNENTKITDLALKLDRRLTIIDDRPHQGWSTNISQLYGMYSALAVGYPPKFESCNLVDWQLSYKPLIILYSEKNIQDSIDLIIKLTSNCKFNGSFEFKEEIDKNTKIFVIKN